MLADTGALDTLAAARVPRRLCRGGQIRPDRPAGILRLAGGELAAEVFAGGPARAQAIAESCRAKADVVARDEFETGDRALLNLGHTFGHALEAATNYDGGRLVHGEARRDRAWRWRIGFRRGSTWRVPDDAERVEAHLGAVGLPVGLADVPGGLPDAEALLGFIAQDKKVSRGTLDLHPDARHRPAPSSPATCRQPRCCRSWRRALAPMIGAALAVAVLLLAAAAAVILRKPLLALLNLELVDRAQRRGALDELRETIDRLSREAQVMKQDRDRVGGLLALHELEVSDVMVHRTNMGSVNADSPAASVVREILQSPHTRMPIWRGTADNIVGVLHAKDLLRALDDVGNDPARVDIAKIASKPWFVPDTTKLKDQLNAFLRRKTHFALVVDEYGEVEGLVTLEDIIEEIVGDIADEHDVEIQGVRQEADGSVVVDGTVPIRDLNRVLDWSLPDDEATTIAGLVIHEAQSIPEEKQAFTFHGKRFIVLDRDKNRLARIRIRPAGQG